MIDPDQRLNRFSNSIPKIISCFILSIVLFIFLFFIYTSSAIKYKADALAKITPMQKLKSYDPCSLKENPLTQHKSHIDPILKKEAYRLNCPKSN